jgi:fructoselysine 6-kinase
MCEDRLAEMAAVAPLSYDFGERPPDYWRPLAPLVSVACLSAGPLSREQAEQLARDVADVGPELVLVTEAARGAMVLAGGAVHRAEAVVTPVDTLGAGDSLIGCFLAGITSGVKPAEALRAATEAAAATCLHIGAFGHVTSYAADGSSDSQDRWPTTFDRHGHPDRPVGVRASSPGGSGP